MATKRSRKRGGSGNPERGDASPGWALVELVLGRRLARMLYLWGPPGIGKTYLAYHCGEGREQGVYACTLTEETPACELRGNWLPRGAELVWADGPVVRAMREGARLVLNEIGHSSFDALTFLHPILEAPETARITLPTGETVSPAPGFEVVATDNAAPDQLPEALRDRFEVSVHLRQPHPDALALLSPAVREAALRSFEIGDDRRPGMRHWLAMDRLRQEVGTERACLLVFGAERGAQIADALVLAGEGR